MSRPTFAIVLFLVGCTSNPPAGGGSAQRAEAPTSAPRPPSPSASSSLMPPAGVASADALSAPKGKPDILSVVVPGEIPRIGTFDSDAKEQKGLVATANGKTYPIKSALAWNEGGSGTTLFLSSNPHPCSAITQFATGQDGELTMQAGVFPVIHPDGSRTWSAKTAAFTVHRKAGSTSKPLNKAKWDITFEKVDLRKGGVTKGALAVEAPDSEVSIKGPIEAVACGRMEMSRNGAKPAEPIPQNVKLTIAGHPVALRGASVSKSENGDVTVRLGTNALTCDVLVGTGDVAARIVLKGGKVDNIVLDGDLLDGRAQGGSAAEFEAKLEGPIEGNGTVPVTLKGSGKLGEYAVTLDGAATALRCPPPKF